MVLVNGLQTRSRMGKKKMRWMVDIEVELI